MERGRRIELLALAWKAKVLPLYEPRIKKMERLVRIELTSEPWQGPVLPFNYSRLWHPARDSNPDQRFWRP